MRKRVFRFLLVPLVTLSCGGAGPVLAQDAATEAAEPPAPAHAAAPDPASEAAPDATPQSPPAAADATPAQVGSAVGDGVRETAELAEARARIDELERQLALAEETRRENLLRIQELRAGNEQANKRANALHRELDKAHDALAATRALIAEHEATLQAGRAAVESLETALGATETALADTRAELVLREASLEEVQSLYDENAARLQSMARQLARAEAEVAALTTRLEAGEAQARERIGELETGLRELLRASLIRVRVLPDERTRVRMSSDRVFLAGQPVISPEGMAMLAELGELFAGSGLGQIRVEVHDDREPGARTARGDRKLSRLRAEALVAQLSRLTGLPAHRFIAAGDGDIQPIASNRDAEGRALNRRVEIYLPSAHRVMPQPPPPMPFPQRMR